MLLLCIVRQGLFLSVNVDDIKLAREKQNLDPMWKKLMNYVDLGEPTSFFFFFGHVHLGCTQRECKPNESMVDDCRKCSNRESLQEQLESHSNRRKMVQTLLRDPTTWKDMQRNELNGTANWQRKQSSNRMRSPHHVLTTISSKKRRVGNGKRTCQKSALKPF